MSHLRLRLSSLALAAVACAHAPRPSAPTSTRSMTIPEVSPRALRVYREALVVDTHNDMPSRILEDGYDPDVRHAPGFGPKEGHTDLPRLIESGLTAEFMSAWVDAPYAAKPGASFERAMQHVSTIRAWVDRHPDRLIFATTAADVRRAKQEGKIAILIGVEGGHAIESSLDRLRELHAHGVRYLTLTWNNGLPWAGSSIGVDGTRRGGLTDFGRDVVREMNRLGMLVDLSHVSDSTFYDAIAVSSVPVIASHSSARAISDFPRNLSDDQLRAIARNGGVVNVNFFSRFLDSEYRARAEAVDAQIDAARRALRAAPDSASVAAQLSARRDSLLAAIPQTPFGVLIDHLDHVARVAGIDHVGLGSDFDGVSALPLGMEDVTRLPRIAQALLDRGYSEGDVKKVLGGNMMRVMTRVLDGAATP
ncbi:MAG: membrane dipeptidase [Gemmatimonadetes bacterium]|nr:MAG: membrane dipeptidase [Gemmatimonadota bacterium]